MSIYGIQYSMNNIALTKTIEKEAISTYIRTFDEVEVGYVILNNRNIDTAIARIAGTEFLKNKKIDAKVDRTILQKKINPETLKVDCYKLSRTDSDGRVKVKALEILGKWEKLEDPSVSNIFNVNMTWASAVQQAHQSKRKVEIIDEDKMKTAEIVNLPAKEITSEPEPE